MGRPARIAIAGGGTGGHVFPALGIADAIREMAAETEFLFFGTAGKIEATVVPDRGYPFRTIWIRGLQRSLRLSNLLFPVRLLVAVVQSWSALRGFRPDVVVGTGGYVCGPVLFAASRMGIPTILHESNSYPGITTRFLASRVDLVLTGSDETGAWLPGAQRVRMVGTPVRSFAGSPGRAEARRRMSFTDTDRVVLVVGGSQGAQSMNRALSEGLTRLRDAGISVVWQTGRANEREAQEQFGTLGHVRIMGFIEDMGMAYAAAELVVSRAGASTIAELALMGKPAILVPYPYAAEDHQMKNARAVEAKGAAVVIPDAEVRGRLVGEIVRLMSDEEELIDLSTSMTSIAAPDAASIIAKEVLEQVREQ